MTKTTSTPIDPVDVAIGGRIRARREELRVTQAQLAAGAGVTFQQIQKYERGVNRIAAARLLQIAAVLKTTGAALLGELDGPAGEDLALAHPGVAQLLQAFRGIVDEPMRAALLAIAAGLARTPPPSRSATLGLVVEEDDEGDAAIGAALANLRRAATAHDRSREH